MAQPIFRRVGLLGVGHIGSSLARALRQHGLAAHIAGHARTQATRDKAVALGLVDSMHEGPAELARGCDLVVICTPVGSYAEIAAAIAPALSAGAIVSDVGSV